MLLAVADPEFSKWRVQGNERQKILLDVSSLIPAICKKMKWSLILNVMVEGGGGGGGVVESGIGYALVPGEGMLQLLHLTYGSNLVKVFFSFGKITFLNQTPNNPSNESKQ